MDNEHYHKALAKIKENQFHEAIELLTKAIEAEPKNPFYFNHRAVSYLNIEKYDLSMFDMNMSIHLDDKYAYFYSCRAFLKTRMKDMDGAISDYETSMELDPENEITYNNLAHALEQVGNMNRAKRVRKDGDELIGYNPEKRELSEDGTHMVDKKDEVKNQESDSDQIKDVQEIEKPKGEVRKERKDLARDVFKKKSTFREFLGFIGNGFKLKDDKEDKA